MSNFEPFSAGDQYAWQQAQVTPPPATYPPSPAQAAADASRHLSMRLSDYPGLWPIVTDLAAAAIEACPEEVEQHVVGVEYRRGLFRSLTTARAEAFPVLPCGVFKVDGRYDEVLERELTIRADGKMFVRTTQDANVRMRPDMRWREISTAPSGLDSHWRGRIAMFLYAKVPEGQRPDFGTLLNEYERNRYTTADTTATARGPARPVSRRKQRKAANIRARTMRLSVVVSNSSKIYEDPNFVEHGPQTRSRRKALRDLERLRAKRDRALERANALDGYEPPMQ